MPVTSAALITYYGPLLTSITAEIVGGRSVLFVGTNDGKLKKVPAFLFFLFEIAIFLSFQISLQTMKNGREYAEVQLSADTVPGVVGSRLTNGTSAVTVVNPDMAFDLTRRHLYVMTKSEVRIF